MTTTWLPRFEHALKHGDLNAALAVLSERATGHAGTPPIAERRLAAKAMLAAVPEAEARWPLAQRLVAAPPPVAAELACDLLVPCYPSHPDEALTLLHGIADHGNWEVREVAAEALGALLTRHWGELYPVCVVWRADPSENVRRAVVLAAKFAGKTRRAERAVALLELLTPLLADRTVYVRKNLGPFAIGSGLLRFYPNETLAWLRERAADSDEVVRWNVAMAFSASDGARYLEDALPVLAQLAADPRPFVRGAVRSALRSLRKRKPAELEAALVSLETKGPMIDARAMRELVGRAE